MNVEFLPEAPIVKFLDTERPDIVKAWRIVSSGFKVGLQSASMCVDTDMLKPGAKVIAIGGSRHGADTAIVLYTFGYEEIFKSNVVEILAMPVNKIYDISYYS